MRVKDNKMDSGLSLHVGWCSAEKHFVTQQLPHNWKSIELFGIILVESPLSWFLNDDNGIWCCWIYFMGIPVLNIVIPSFNWILLISVYELNLASLLFKLNPKFAGHFNSENYLETLKRKCQQYSNSRTP